MDNNKEIMNETNAETKSETQRETKAASGGNKPLINIDLSEYVKPDSLIKGIIFTEIFSPPKAKRRGMRR